MKCSLGISNFLEEISHLSHSVVFLYFFALIAEEGFVNSSCYSLELCIQMFISFLFSFAFCFSSLDPAHTLILSATPRLETAEERIQDCLDPYHILLPDYITFVCLNCGRPRFEPWVGKIPWRRKWQSTPVLLPGKSHGQRSLVGYSPWGCKELDTIERLHFHFHFHFTHQGRETVIETLAYCVHPLPGKDYSFLLHPKLCL